MNIIEPSVEIWEQGQGIQGMYDHIERCARICYRSENKGNTTSEEFVKRLIKNNHGRTLEFGTLLFDEQYFEEMLLPGIRPGYFTWINFDFDDVKDDIYVTNLRLIVENFPNDWEKIITNALWDHSRDFKEYRPTIHWHISRAIADEFRTHVLLSSLCESTRYVNYAKKGLDFIKPCWLPTERDVRYCIFEQGILRAEDHYLALIEDGLQPQQAREVLPLSIATNLVQCGFKSAWKNFFNRRIDNAAHKDARMIAEQAKTLLGNF